MINHLAPRRLPALISLLLGAALCSSALAVTYKAKDIGDVGPGGCYFNKMNLKAQIVGACFEADDVAYTAYATDAKGKNIHTVGKLSGNWSWTNGLNDDGVLVGDATIAGDVISHAWIQQPGGAMTDLGTLGGDNSFALNINNKGLIVGNSQFDASGSFHGFVIQPGTSKMIDVGNLGGTQLSVWRVTEKGIIGGVGTLAGDTEFRGFYAKPPYSKLVVLNSFGGSSTSVGGINESGVIVGTSRTAGDALRRAFVGKVGSKAITDLGTPAGQNSVASSINNKGQIVGSYRRAADNLSAPYLCTNDCSDFLDLNTVTTGLPAGIELRNAQGINDKGLITGQGSDGRIYLLTPQ
jgi:probable HAF family extracellular repeat protein